MATYVHLSEKAPNLEERFIPMLGETSAWDVYNNEARKVDNELVKDWTASLNSLLVFAAIFAAVLAAFIIESKKLLEQDTASLMLEVMIIYTNNMANGSHTPYTRIDFKPDGIAISINCLLFGSLSTSLVAALASVVALQWVAEYDAAITRGGSSPEDRAKRRQFRFAGVESWKMGGIIATLPLLLYFSVVLFFIGIIQWMVLLNPTVGYIVIAGAVIAALFYLSSTIIAVLYVSAPFKSPITRWIYFAYHVALIGIHWILIKARVKSIPMWIESACEDIHMIHKREDLTVATRNDLKYQALDWLVHQVSISEDSRQRLVLLVGHLLKWPSIQLHSREFAEAPWISILNLLAQTHLQNAHVPEQSHEEEQELAILVNCAALPGIAAVIAPTDYLDYWKIRSSARYWYQHCTNSQGHRPTIDSNSPSTLFLLTRDLPVPSLQSKDEIRAIIRLAKWRNSEVKTLDIWKDIFDKNNAYSDKFFGSLICLMEAYFNSEIADPIAFKVQDIVFPSFAAIVQRAASGTISSSTLDTLIHLFERYLTADSLRKTPTNKSDACVRLPLLYAQGLSGERRDDSVKRSHRIITLLLARDLQICPKSERPRRLNDVLGMIWLYGFTEAMHLWPQFDHSHGAFCTMEGLHQDILRDWILYADDSTETKEIFSSLLQIFVAGEDPGNEWLSNCTSQSRRHLFSLVRVIDRLVCDDHKSVKDITQPTFLTVQSMNRSPSILKTLCTILKTDQFKSCGPRPYTDGCEFDLGLFRDPYVRTIAYRALEIPRFEEIMPNYPPDSTTFFASPEMTETADYMLWNMHESDSEIVWKLRAGLISENFSKMPPTVKDLFTEAFTTPGRLAFLQRIFNHKTSCNHHSGRGHLLQHLEIHWNIIFRGSDRLIHTVNLQNQTFSMIPGLLAISKVDDLPLLVFPADYKMECIAQVWNYLQSIKSDPSEYLRFLLELLISPIYSGMLYGYVLQPGSIAVILQTIENSLEYPSREGSIPVLRQLAKRALDLPRLIAPGLQSLGQPKIDEKIAKALIQYGVRVHDRALTSLAITMVYGRRNLCMLSCARLRNGSCPATGWIPMHID